MNFYIFRLNDLLFEYFYTAIKLDPLIENREEVLKEAVRNCKVMYGDNRAKVLGMRGLRVWSPNEEQILRHISFDHKIIKSNATTRGCNDRMTVENEIEMEMKEEFNIE